MPKTFSNKKIFVNEVNYLGLLVTGGSGLLGHALQKIKPNALYISSKDYDLTKEKEVKAMFEEHKPTHVLHLAARVGGIKDNMKHPAEFIHQNILINTQVVHYAYKYNVEKLIGILSNCAYPDVAKKYPLKEEQLYDGPPQSTNFAYAYSKRVLGVQIDSYRKQYGCNFFSVIPCNLYGPYDNFNETHSHFVASLLKKIHEAKKNKKNTLPLLGSGKPLRQYLYSEDLAQILLLLLDKYDSEGPINIAPKDENPAIKDIARIALKSTKSENIKITFDTSFPDGQYRKDLCIGKQLKIIGDFEFTSLSEGLKKTYEWYIKNADTQSKLEEIWA